MKITDRLVSPAESGDSSKGAEVQKYKYSIKKIVYFGKGGADFTTLIIT